MITLMMIINGVLWQIRAVFQDSALGFTLVDSSLEQTIEADQLAVNSTSQVIIDHLGAVVQLQLPLPLGAVV